MSATPLEQHSPVLNNNGADRVEIIANPQCFLINNRIKGLAGNIPDYGSIVSKNDVTINMPSINGRATKADEFSAYSSAYQKIKVSAIPVLIIAGIILALIFLR